MMVDFTKEELLADIEVMMERMLDRKLEEKLEEKLDEKLKNFATKDDLTKGLNDLERRLRIKIEEASQINIKHHLETKAAVGSLEGRYMSIKEGLAAAGA